MYHNIPDEHTRITRTSNPLEYTGLKLKNQSNVTHYTKTS